MVPEGIYGPEVDIKIREPKFLVAEEEIQESQLAERVKQLAKAPNFERFVFEFLLDPKNRTHILIVKPVHHVEEGLYLGEPCLICRSVSRLERMECLEIPHLWLTRGLLVGMDSELYDRTFISRLQSPVFLQLRPFSWDLARLTLRSHSAPLHAAQYTIAGQPLFTVSALSSANVTAFGMTTPRFPPAGVVISGVEGHEGPIEDEPLISSVVLIVMNSSYEHGIIAGSAILGGMRDGTAIEDTDAVVIVAGSSALSHDARTLCGLT